MILRFLNLLPGVQYAVVHRTDEKIERTCKTSNGFFKKSQRRIFRKEEIHPRGSKNIQDK